MDAYMKTNERTLPEPDAISALPITPQERTVLGYMSRHGPICVSVACKKLNMSQPKLQKIKASLERKGLVTLAKTEPGERNPELVRKYYDLTVPGFCELVVATVGLPVWAADVAYGDLILESTQPSSLPGFPTPAGHQGLPVWMPEVSFEEPASLPAGNLLSPGAKETMHTVSFQDFMQQSGHTGWFDADAVLRLVRRHAPVCPLFFANWEAIVDACNDHPRLQTIPGVSVVLDGRTACCVILQAAMRRVSREIRMISSQMISDRTVFSAPVSRVPALLEGLVTEALLREFLPGPDRMYRPYVTVLGEVEELRPVVREYLAGMQERCVRQGEELGEMLVGMG